MKKIKWDEREVDGAIMDFQSHVRKVTGGNNYSCVDSTKLKIAIDNTIQKAISQAEQRGYEKGVADERRRIGKAVSRQKKYNLENHKGEYCIGIDDALANILSIIHD